MLTSVDVYSEANELVLNLPVYSEYPEGPYTVKKIEGLTPAKADIYTANNIGQDGAMYKGARTGMRNIVFTLGYNYDHPTHRANVYLRGDIYARFPPKGSVRMVFHSDNHESIQIEGFVESVESEIFSRMPDVQISIICPDPYFSSLTQRSITGTDGQNLTIPRLGNAPTPFIFKTERLVEDFGFLQLKNALDQKISIYHSYSVNDEIYINTIPGSKQAKIYRWDSLHANILDGVRSGNMGMVFDSRATYLRLLNDAPSTGKITYKVWYTPKYLGL